MRCRQGSFRFGFNNQHLYPKSGITLPGGGGEVTERTVIGAVESVVSISFII